MRRSVCRFDFAGNKNIALGDEFLRFCIQFTEFLRRDTWRRGEGIGNKSGFRYGFPRQTLGEDANIDGICRERRLRDLRYFREEWCRNFIQPDFRQSCRPERKVADLGK